MFDLWAARFSIGWHNSPRSSRDLPAATVAVCRWRVNPRNTRRGMVLSDARACPAGHQFVAPRHRGAPGGKEPGQRCGLPFIVYAQIHPRLGGGPDRRDHPASGCGGLVASRNQVILDQPGLAYLSPGRRHRGCCRHPGFAHQIGQGRLRRLEVELWRRPGLDLSWERPLLGLLPPPLRIRVEGPERHRPGDADRPWGDDRMRDWAACPCRGVAGVPVGIRLVSGEALGVHRFGDVPALEISLSRPPR